MANQIYRQTISEAWRIARRHKFLWFFGFFAILLNSGVASGVETFFNNVSLLANAGDNIQQVEVLYKTNTLGFIATNVADFFTALTFENALTILLILAIYVFVVWISVLSQGALITSTDTFRQGKSVAPEQAFANGTRVFWPLFWLNAFKYILSIGAVIILGTPLLSLYLVQGYDVWLNLLLFLNFLILVPAAMLFAFLLQFASAYVAIRRQPLWLAVKNAWHLFAKHWLATLEMAFLLFLVYVVATAILSIVFAPQILNLFVNSATGALPGMSGYLNVSFIALAIIAIFLTSIFSTFQYVATTLFFLKLEEGVITAKFVRWFGHWGNVGSASPASPKLAGSKAIK